MGTGAQALLQVTVVMARRSDLKFSTEISNLTMVNSFEKLNVASLVLIFGPTQVFLDENNVVKLGDFGLSKALAQASFANTYVGVSLAIKLRHLNEVIFIAR